MSETLSLEKIKELEKSDSKKKPQSQSQSQPSGDNFRGENTDIVERLKRESLILRCQTLTHEDIENDVDRSAEFEAQLQRKLIQKNQQHIIKELYQYQKLSVLEQLQYSKSSGYYQKRDVGVPYPTTTKLPDLLPIPTTTAATTTTTTELPTNSTADENEKESPIKSGKLTPISAALASIAATKKSVIPSAKELINQANNLMMSSGISSNINSNSGTVKPVDSNPNYRYSYNSGGGKSLEVEQKENILNQAWLHSQHQSNKMISKLPNAGKKVVQILEDMKQISKDDSVSVFHIALKQFCERYKQSLRFEISETDAAYKLSRTYFCCEAVVDGLKHGTHLAQSKREAKSLASMSAMARLMTFASSKECPTTQHAIDFFWKFNENQKKKAIHFQENYQAENKLNPNSSKQQNNPKNQNHKNNKNNNKKNANQNNNNDNHSNCDEETLIRSDPPNHNNNNNSNDDSEEKNYREELSVFAHKNLHLPVTWELVLGQKEKMWLAIVSVGNLTERGIGKNKKQAKNEAAFKLLQRCSDLNVKDPVEKPTMKRNKQKALMKQQHTMQLLEKQQHVVQMEQSHPLVTQILEEKLKQQQLLQQQQMEQQLQYHLQQHKLKQQQQQEQQQQQQPQPIPQPLTIPQPIPSLHISKASMLKSVPKMILFPEKDTSSVSSSIQDTPIKHKQDEVRRDVAIMIQDHSEIYQKVTFDDYTKKVAATETQYQILGDMVASLQKEVLKNSSKIILKQLIPVGSFPRRLLRKEYLVVDIIATLKMKPNSKIDQGTLKIFLEDDIQYVFQNSSLPDVMKVAKFAAGSTLLTLRSNNKYRIRLIAALHDEASNSAHSIFYDEIQHSNWISKHLKFFQNCQTSILILRAFFFSCLEKFRLPFEVIDIILSEIITVESDAKTEVILAAFVEFVAKGNLQSFVNSKFTTSEFAPLVERIQSLDLTKIQQMFFSIHHVQDLKKLFVM